MELSLQFTHWLHYYNAVFCQVQNEFTRKHYQEILLLPVILVAVFGVVSVAIIAYRVYTFNDCLEASEELQRQIKEAKADLAKKGLKLD